MYAVMCLVSSFIAWTSSLDVSIAPWCWRVGLGASNQLQQWHKLAEHGQVKCMDTVSCATTSRLASNVGFYGLRGFTVCRISSISMPSAGCTCETKFRKCIEAISFTVKTTSSEQPCGCITHVDAVVTFVVVALKTVTCGCEFAVKVKYMYGAVVIAVLQCGSTLMPSGAAEHAHMFRNNEARAIACLEELVEWLARVADAYVAHKKDPATQRAREYSGIARGQSGLTAAQQQLRSRRGAARTRLHRANTLQREARAYTNRDYREFRCPRGWFQLAHWEPEEIRVLERGDLQRACDEAAAAHGGAVTARSFRL